MSEQLHSGLHPDPDSLNAFLEGVLPEHERLQCLAHLAECSRCREIVFLAQEPPPAPAAPQPTTTWKRWFAPIPLLAAAAALCVAVVAIWLSTHRTAGVPTGDMVARVSQVPPSAARPPAPDETTTRQPSKPVQTKPEPEKVAAGPSPKTVPPAPHRALPVPTYDTTPPSLPTPPSVSTATGAIENAQAPVLPALPSTIPPSPNTPSVEIREKRAGISGISGTVTDPSGAVISGATVKVRQLDGTVTADARTDLSGEFNVAELPAGRYELQIGAPGFRQSLREVDLRPRELASVKSQLEVGSVAEAVEVTAAAPTLQTESASVSRKPSRKKAQPEEPRPLPSKLPTDSSVTSGKITLAVDSGGVLFVSRNSGKSWKTVKPVWPGKVRSIAPANPSPGTNATFQLTTDSGAVWLSLDGARWYQASSRR
jgi:Carboxypeptidase regulatory-like domain/Putative zinc-finger